MHQPAGRAAGVAGGHPGQRGRRVPAVGRVGRRAEQQRLRPGKHAGDAADAAVRLQRQAGDLSAAEQRVRQRGADGAAVLLARAGGGAGQIPGGKAKRRAAAGTDHPGRGRPAGRRGQAGGVLPPQGQVDARIPGGLAQSLGLGGGQRGGKAQLVAVRRQVCRQQGQPQHRQRQQRPAQGPAQPRPHCDTRTQAPAESGLSAPETTCLLMLPDTAAMPSPCASTVTGRRTSTFCWPSRVDRVSIR